MLLGQKAQKETLINGSLEDLLNNLQSEMKKERENENDDDK